MTSTPRTGTRSPSTGSAASCATADGLRVEDVSFAYGKAAVVNAVSFVVPPGSFFVLLGESGCGKTTLLKLVGGSLVPSAGSIHLGGIDLARLPPERRGVGTVFQSYALFP